MGAIIGFMIGLRVAPKQYSLTVTENKIAATGPASPFETAVSRGEIRSIIPMNGNCFYGAGLLISERSRFGTWLWGGVWVPKELPEYEYVRDLAESWKKPANA